MSEFYLLGSLTEEQTKCLFLLLFWAIPFVISSTVIVFLGIYEARGEEGAKFDIIPFVLSAIPLLNFVITCIIVFESLRMISLKIYDLWTIRKKHKELMSIKKNLINLL